MNATPAQIAMLTYLDDAATIGVEYQYHLIDDADKVCVDNDVHMTAFVALNDLDAEEVADINRAHEDRRGYTFGGGAAPVYTLLRSRKV
jgi:hypothetical protein